MAFFFFLLVFVLVYLQAVCVNNTGITFSFWESITSILVQFYSSDSKKIIFNYKFYKENQDKDQEEEEEEEEGHIWTSMSEEETNSWPVALIVFLILITGTSSNCVFLIKNIIKKE